MSDKNSRNAAKDTSKNKNITAFLPIYVNAKITKIIAHQAFMREVKFETVLFSAPNFAFSINATALETTSTAMSPKNRFNI